MNIHTERLFDLQASIKNPKHRFEYDSLGYCIYGHCLLLWPSMTKHGGYTQDRLAEHLGMSHDDIHELFYGGVPWRSVTRGDAVRAIQFYIDHGRVDWKASTPWWCIRRKWCM